MTDTYASEVEDKTAEALIQLSEVIDKFGFDSREVKVFVEQNRSLPEFEVLAAETLRLERQFVRPWAQSRGSTSRLVRPNVLSHGIAAVLAFALGVIAGPAALLPHYAGNQQINQIRLKQAESSTPQVANTTNEHIADSIHSPVSYNVENWNLTTGELVGNFCRSLSEGPLKSDARTTSESVTWYKIAKRQYLFGKQTLKLTNDSEDDVSTKISKLNLPIEWYADAIRLEDDPHLTKLLARLASKIYESKAPVNTTAPAESFNAVIAPAISAAVLANP